MIVLHFAGSEITVILLTRGSEITVLHFADHRFRNHRFVLLAIGFRDNCLKFC